MKTPSTRSVPEIYEKAVTEQGLKAVGAPSVVDMDTTEEGNVALTVSTALVS